MSGSLLLDTNIVIAVLNGDETIPPRLDAAEIVGISVTVIGELLYGAKKSRHVQDIINKIKRFKAKGMQPFKLYEGFKASGPFQNAGI